MARSKPTARSKSTRLERVQTRDAGSLLRKLSGNANLPTYIRQLPAPALTRLIDDVGLEDSQEILAFVTPEQLRQVLSTALWTGGRPGREEILDLDQFMRWLGVWMEDGERTLVQRVLELGADFTVMCFARLLTAVDRTTEGLQDSEGVEIGHYLILPRQEKHWHKVVDALTTLWHHEPDFTLGLLRRCSFVRSILNDDASETAATGTLYEDIAAERSAQRAGAGYVDPIQASVFLMTAKTTPLRELFQQQTYDANTAEYLGKQQRLVTRTAQNEATHHPEPPLSEGGSTQTAAVDEPAPGEMPDFAELDSLLRDAGILEPPPQSTPLLTDQRTGPARSEWVETALAALAAARPDVASRRIGELAYLSNVLISGAEVQGKGFSETQAARMAIATANLGATYVLGPSTQPGLDAERVNELLEQDPGLVRLFQIGYHLLCRVPGRVCEAVYRAKAVQARRPGHVVIMEMDAVLGASRLTELVQDSLYGEAKSLIDGLSAVMEAAACVALRILIDPTPCFPKVLDGGGSDAVYVDRGHRPIATIEDLERIAEFLDDLPDYCGT